MDFSFFNNGLENCCPAESTQISPLLWSKKLPADARRESANCTGYGPRAKIKPIEYVKVCSLYGAGFYYIPGTDTCLKIGGYVRNDWVHNSSGSFTVITDGTASGNGTSGRYTLTDNNDLVSRSRGVVTFDARSQTEYGTLRSYFKGGIQYTTNDAAAAPTSYYERAFIQFAGFTFGLAQSFFDFFPYPALSYQTPRFADTGGGGVNLIAYTAQLGNGATATLALEKSTRRSFGHQPVDVTGTTGFALTAAALGGGLPSDNALGQSIPDIIGALRVDQSWGSAQISGAAHQINTGYYGVNITPNGHPDREWGWAVSAGLQLNLPTGPGDLFAISTSWATGALGYISAVGNFTSFGTGGRNGIYAGSVALIPIAEAIYGTAGDAELVDGWNIYAGLKHNWSTNLWSSLYGGYMAISWDGAARNLYCTGSKTATLTGCDPSGEYWQLGSLTQWEPVKNFTIGLEIMYTKMNSGSFNNGALGNSITYAGAVGANPTGTYKVEDLDRWHGQLRVQRNFWP